MHLIIEHFSSINRYMPLGGGPGCYFTCKVISPLACGHTICCAPATVPSVHYDKKLRGILET